MKINSVLILLLAASVLFNFIQWRTNSHGDVVVEGKFITIEVAAGTDTKPRPAPAARKKTDSSATREIIRRDDSVQAAIDTSSHEVADSLKLRRSAPVQFAVNDSLTINYVTWDPLQQSATIDSTYYRRIHWEVPYADTLAIYNSGPGMRTYAAAGAGAVIGASIGGPGGAGIGAIGAILLDEIAEKIF